MKRSTISIYSRESCKEFIAAAERFWRKTQVREAAAPRCGITTIRDDQSRLQQLTKPYREQIRADAERLRQYERLAAESM